MFRVLLFLCLFIFSLHSFADPKKGFQTAINLFNEKKYHESLVIFRDLVEVYPTNGLYWFNLANANYMLGDYDKAIYSYKKAELFTSNLQTIAKLYQAKASMKLNNDNEAKNILLSIDSNELSSGVLTDLDDLLLELSSRSFDKGMLLYDSKNFASARAVFEDILSYDYWDDAEFMLAICEMKLGYYQKAIKNFESVIKNTESDDVKKKAEFFIEELSETYKEPEQLDPLSLYFKVGGGYNTNVYVDGRTDDPEGKPEATVLANIDYRFFSVNGFSFQSSYSLIWDEIIGDTSLRFISHSFDFVFSYDENKWFFRLVPQFEYQHFDYNADVYKVGSFVMLGNSITDIQEVGFTYNLYKDMTGSTYYDYMKGNEHVAKIFWGIKPRNIYVGINYGYYVQDIGDIIYTDGTSLPFGYKAHGPELRTEFYPSDTWSVYLTTSYLLKSYNKPALPDNILRKDKTLTIYTELQKEISNGFRFFLSLNSIINSSTLDSTTTYNENYTQFKALGGIKWELQQ